MENNNQAENNKDENIEKKSNNNVINDNSENEQFNILEINEKFGYPSNQPLFYLLEHKCSFDKYPNPLSVKDLIEMYESGEINKRKMRVKLVDIFTYNKKYEFFPIAKIFKRNWVNNVEYSDLFEENKKLEVTSNNDINIRVDDFMLKDFNDILSLSVKERKENLSCLLNDLFEKQIKNNN